MKTKRNKRILSGLFAFALLATTAVGVAESKKSEATMSDLAMANVEALANGENGGSSCSVGITCLDGANISCQGTECRYQRDEWHTIGYVCCNDNYTYCQG